MLYLSWCLFLLPFVADPVFSEKSPSSTFRPQQASSAATNTTGSSSATTTYNVFPADYLDRDANNEIGQVISSLPGLSPESVKNWSALDPANGLFMWQAPLNDASVTKINHTKGVGRVEPICTGNGCGPGPTDLGNESVSWLQRRDNGPSSLNSARDEMTFLSSYPPRQPRPYSSRDYNNLYVADGSRGSNVWVYIMGENDHILTNNQFDHLKPDNPTQQQWTFGDDTRVTWYGRYYDGFSFPTHPTYDNGHGTQVLSKVVGKTYGAAPNVNVVLMRWPLDEGMHDLDKMGLIAMQARDHWNRHKSQSPGSVGLMSYSRGVEPVVYEPGGSHVSSTSPKNVARLNGWAGILRDCVADGLIPVAAAGNDGNEAPVRAYPQLFASTKNWAGNLDFQSPPVPQLIIVGGVDNNGKLASFSSGENDNPKLVKQYAPSVRVRLANDRRGFWKFEDGTSYAAAAVAGILATWAGLTSVVDQWITQDATRNSLQARVQWLYDRFTAEPEVDKLSGEIQNIKNRWSRGTQGVGGGFPNAIWNGYGQAQFQQVCNAQLPQFQPSRIKRDNATDESSCPALPPQSNLTNEDPMIGLQNATATSTSTLAVSTCQLEIEVMVQTGGADATANQAAVDLYDGNDHRVNSIGYHDISPSFNVTGPHGLDVQIGEWENTNDLQFYAPGEPEGWQSTAINTTGKLPYCKSTPWQPAISGGDLASIPGSQQCNITCWFSCSV